MEKVFGLNAVMAVLEHSVESATCLYLDERRKDQRTSELEALARNKNIKIERISRQKLNQSCPSNIQHQGVMLEKTAAQPTEKIHLKDLLEQTEGALFFLVLDGVQDPHNLGACLRSADAAGVTAVIAPKDKAVGLTPIVRKVASGAAETTPFIQVTNLARTLRELQDAGVWVIGSSGDATQSLFETEFKGSVALVMGAEGKGIRRLTRELCDELIVLPMLGAVESLNVSVATGICLYEVVRQRTTNTG